MNLSCGKCKAIQPFSGVPPTCEVCGWVCSTTNMRTFVAEVTPTKQNLSCGKCKVIRSFSGVPPTCEVCGWVCSTTNIRALQATTAAPNPVRDLPTPQTVVTSTPTQTTKQTTDGEGCGTAAGCLLGLLVLAFYAGCALVAIALMVWAWHYLFG